MSTLLSNSLTSNCSAPLLQAQPHKSFAQRLQELNADLSTLQLTSVYFRYLNPRGGSARNVGSFPVPLSSSAFKCLLGGCPSGWYLGFIPNAVECLKQEDGSNKWEYEPRMFIVELDTKALSVEEQRLAFLSTGLPFTRMMWSGGKSLHIAVRYSSAPASTLEHQQIVCSYLWHYAKAAGLPYEDDTAVDKSAKRLGQPYRTPAFPHHSGSFPQLLDAPGTLVNPASIGEFFISTDALGLTTKGVPKQARIGSYRCADTREQLYAIAKDFTNDFDHISEAYLKDYKSKLQEDVRTIRRGSNAPTAVWELGLKFGKVALVESVGAPKFVTVCMSLLRRYIGNDSERGVWNESEYQLQLVRGISQAIQHERAKRGNFERELKPTIPPVNMKHISNLPTEDLTRTKLTLVASGVGTGKTTLVNNYLGATSPDRFLGVAHLRSLANEMNAKLPPNLKSACYDDSVFTVRQSRSSYQCPRMLSSYPALVISVDSLVHIKSAKAYDVVHLEEVDQLLRYLMIGTGTSLETRRRSCYETLAVILSQAKHVIATSAHVSNLEVEVLKLLCGTSEATVICNEHAPALREIVFIPTDEENESKLLNELKQGGKAAVYCDTAAKVLLLKNKFTSEGFNVVTLLGETTADERVQLFSNLESTLKQADVFVYSPSGMTGLDINFSHFTTAYAFLSYAEAAGVYDAEQAINRVRQLSTNTISIWCDSFANWATTDKGKLEALYRVQTATDEEHAQLQTFLKADGTMEYMFSTCCFYNSYKGFQLEYLQRTIDEAIYRNYKLHKLLLLRGHTVSSLPEQDQLAPDTIRSIRKANRSAANDIKKVKALEIAEARKLNDEGYSNLKRKRTNNKNKRLSKADQSAVEAYIIRKDTGWDTLTQEQVFWYLHEGGRKVAQLWFYLTTSLDKCRTIDARERFTNQDEGYDSQYAVEKFEYVQKLLTLASTLVPEIVGDVRDTKDGKIRFDSNNARVKKAQQELASNAFCIRELGLHKQRVLVSFLSVCGFNARSYKDEGKFKYTVGDMHEFAVSIADHKRSLATLALED